MKKLMRVSATAASVLVLSLSALAADSPASPDKGSKTMVKTSQTKQTSAGRSTKSKSKTVIGTVKTFEAGKKIEVTGPKDKTYSFDLNAADTPATVDPSVAVGSQVKVVSRTEADGKKSVAVLPHAAVSHRAVKKSSSSEKSSTKQSS